MKNYHCCATCKHFKAEKIDTRMKYLCSRLGYETKTNYQFNCWNPREDIKEQLKKDQLKN